MNEYIIYLGKDFFARAIDIVDAYNLYNEAVDLAKVIDVDVVLADNTHAEVIEYYNPSYDI